MKLSDLIRANNFSLHLAACPLPDEPGHLYFVSIRGGAVCIDSAWFDVVGVGRSMPEAAQRYARRIAGQLLRVGASYVHVPDDLHHRVTP